MLRKKVPEGLRLGAGQRLEIVGDKVEIACANVGVGGDQHRDDEVGKACGPYPLRQLLVRNGDHRKRLAGGFR